MKGFPSRLIPTNRDKFPQYRFNRELCKLRAKVVDYMYSGDTGGMDLELQPDIKSELLEKITTELHILGWKTLLEFGDSTLFIYTDDNDLPQIVRDNKNNVFLDC